MIKIKIDKHIPIPSIRGSLKPKYPFFELKVGHSFYVKGIKAKRLYLKAYYLATRANNKMKFIARHERQGARIWRVK